MMAAAKIKKLSVTDIKSFLKRKDETVQPQPAMIAYEGYIVLPHW